MRRRALALLLAAACGPGPDDLFVVGGRVLSQRFEPLDAVPVSVSRTLSDGCAPDGELLHRERSADGGLFSFDLLRVEVQAIYRGGVICTRLQADYPSGAAAWADFYTFPSQLTLPDFNDWAPHFSVDPDGGVSFVPVIPEDRPLAQCSGNFPTQETVVHAVEVRIVDGGTLWEQSDHLNHIEVVDAGSTVIIVKEELEPVVLELPPDVLEDAPVELTLEAKRLGCIGVTGNLGGLGLAQPYEVITRWSNPERVRAQGTRRPVSRGARCAGFVADCPLTDGDPTPISLREPTNDFRLTLAAPALVRTIVLRGVQEANGRPPNTQLSVRVGMQSVTVDLLEDQEGLDDLVFLSDGQYATRDWRRVVLPAALGPSTDVALELNRDIVRIGEISLFSE
jgi:hypothetical protein